jgi:aspartate-semialdehyde dehydrogenase
MHFGWLASMTEVAERIPVALLGASGLVAQRFIQRLSNHPWFDLVAVAASQHSAGLTLDDLRWILDEPAPAMPPLTVMPLDSAGIIDELQRIGVRIIFSALPAEIASIHEPKFAEAGFAVLSNASAHRHTVGVPLVIADLNPHHLLMLSARNEDECGFIACSTNCTVVPVALPLKPLWDMLGFSRVQVKTEQALSGGGRDLLEAAIASGSVDPEIPGEAKKVTAELLRILGRAGVAGNQPANIEVAVDCRRVMEKHGHLVHVEVELNQVVSLEELLEWWTGPTPRAQTLRLPSAPTPPLRFIDGMPNAARDRFAGATLNENTEGKIPTNPASDLRAGMAVTIGAIEIDGSTLKFSALADNTLRGAAGGCVLLAELLLAEGLIP